MRAALLVIVAVVVIFVVVVTGGAVNSVATNPGTNARTTNLACNAALGPWQGDGEAKGRADAGRLNEEQQGYAALIISIGRQRNLPALAWQIAIQAGMTESGLRNLTYGDRDSVGIFQMRPSMGWGNVAQVTDPVYEVNKFFDVLEKLPDWKDQRPGQSSQGVERSAFPDRYHQWEAMAAFLIAQLGQVQDPSGCGQSNGNLLPPPTEAAGQAVQFALGQQGKAYVWGATGPNTFDCSGLMLRAYESAGMKLPRVSRDQYHAGAYLAVKDAQPGDLLFWAYAPNDPQTIHHVAMYLGNDQYVQAPQTGDVVKISKINWNDRELVAQAVRPGV